MEDQQETVVEENTARDEFYRFVREAKAKCKDCKYEEALISYTKALEIHHSSKLEKKIHKLKAFIEELKNDDDDDDDNDEDYYTIDGYKMYKGMWEKLYPHQQDGVKWMWGLYRQKRGGILGDDMGLGKTIQIIAFLTGMFDAGLVKSAIIVMPVSLLPNWRNEFEKWAPGIRLSEFHGAKGRREKELHKIQQKDGVLLTSYGMIVSSYEKLGLFEDQRFSWDYIILDEGHKIKNPTKTAKCARLVPAKSHFILSGTPIQNNLRELWSLMDFVTEGKLLGTSKTFKTEFENPIVRARERDASNYEKKMGNQISETLRSMIAPYFLQRTKKEVFATEKSDQIENIDGETPRVEEMSHEKQNIKMTKKQDLIIWLFLSDIQLQIYKDFLQLDNIREAMNSTRSPLADLTMLKKIADHPRLLSSAACGQLGLSEDVEQSEDVLLEESSKLQFTLKLVKDLKKNGHRTLIFSQSRKMLDIVDKIFTREDIKLMRFDGRIIDPMERQKLINTFQTDHSYCCCLLTTQVGAVGLNLTGADRVIIFDPSWNPGNDAQAVDRAYRIGQRKDVVIYRLITCGTIEEKIYRKQIFKMSISNQTTGSSKNPYRYFARNELRELFILENPKVSITYGILEELHAKQRPTPLMHDHFQFLKSLGIYGISDHSLVYSKEASNVDENGVDSQYDSQIIERARRAEKLVTSEVNICAEMSDLSLHPKTARKKNEDIRNYMPNLKTKKVGSVEVPRQSKTSYVISDESILIPDSPISHDVTEEVIPVNLSYEISQGPILLDTPPTGPRYSANGIDDSTENHEGLLNGIDASGYHDDVQVIPSSPNDDVIPSRPNGYAIPSSPNDDVIPSSPDHDVIPSSPNDDFIPSSPYDNAIPSSPNDDVIPSSPNDDVIPSSPYDDVIPSSPNDYAIPSSPYDDVIPSSPNDYAIPSSPNDDVIPSSPYDDVIPSSPNGDFIPSSPNDDFIDSRDDDFVEVADVGCSPIVFQHKECDPTSHSTAEKKRSFHGNAVGLLQTTKESRSSYDDGSVPLFCNSATIDDNKTELTNSLPTQPVPEGLEIHSSHSTSNNKMWMNSSTLEASSEKRRSFHWSEVRGLQTAEESERPYDDGSVPLFSNSAAIDDNKTDSHLTNSLSTQPVPEGLEIYSEPSDTSLSFIADPNAQEADTVLIVPTQDASPSVQLERTEARIWPDQEVNAAEDGNLQHTGMMTKPSPVDLSYRSLEIVESDSNVDSDQTSDYDEDPDIDIRNQNTSYNRSLQVEDDSDETESEDELLLKSRRSLRRSILSKPKSPPLSTSLPSLDGSLTSPQGMSSRFYEPNKNYSDLDSSIDLQEADTLQLSDADSQPPLVVWDKPFYKRTPGKPSKDPLHPIQNFQMADTVQILRESKIWSPAEKEIPETQNKVFSCPCGKHKMSSGIKINSCECSISAEGRLRYHELLKNAKDLLNTDNELPAMECYFDALEIADHDLKIQQTACILAKGNSDTF